MALAIPASYILLHISGNCSPPVEVFMDLGTIGTKGMGKVMEEGEEDMSMLMLIYM